ncbi:outer membrane protein OmpA-like peptidoglycan-associated protein [Prauserella shujinwangii]|uniref:Outer membrane protein OmpA-like peptidoglycan-associated protein n=1 Tax=Prauserella shujinwangii TaxID=1453103 RepID=A0A2T0M194_9PSEU|nr:OmpA family protein [Prauserella shujinwangii]PRX50320.1 outer membrane protein OmpA-like peptidoglycan-associated protein [Prauserella shujinwangii]
MPGARRLLWLIPLALVVTGGLAAGATFLGADRIESDLTARTRDALVAAELPSATVAFDGRDASIGNVPADQRGRARSVVLGVAGVRTAEVTGQPAEQAPEAGGHVKRDLQVRLDQLLAAEPITFQPDTAELTVQGTRSVSRVADMLTAAPANVTFEVGGHVARVPGGDPEGARTLSEERARVVANKLVEAGIAEDRVRAVGYGDTRPRSESGTTDLDRRVEITVR